MFKVIEYSELRFNARPVETVLGTAPTVEEAKKLVRGPILFLEEDERNPNHFDGVVQISQSRIKIFTIVPA